MPPVEWSELRVKLKGDIAYVSHDLASFQRIIIIILIGFALTIWVSLLVA